MNAEGRRAVLYFLLSPALLLSPKGRAGRQRKLHFVALDPVAWAASTVEERTMNAKSPGSTHRPNSAPRGYPNGEPPQQKSGHETRLLTCSTVLLPSAKGRAGKLHELRPVAPDCTKKRCPRDVPESW